MFVFKGRSRDSAWFSILDKEWLKNKKRFLNYFTEIESSEIDRIVEEEKNIKHKDEDA